MKTVFAPSAHWIVAFVAIAYLTPNAAGQNKAAPLEPHLFLIYALEDFCREPLPDHHNRLGEFVARRKIQHDQLLVFLTKEKTPNEDLIGKVEESRKILEAVKDVVKRVEECRKKHYAPVVEACTKLNYENVRQNQLTVLAGLGTFTRARDQGDSSENALLRGFVAAGLQARDGQLQLKTAFDKYWTALTAADQDFKKEVATFYPEAKATLDKRLRTGLSIDKKFLAQLSTQYRWTVNNVEFNPNADPADWGKQRTTPNPLLILRYVQHLNRTPPEGIKAAKFYESNAQLLFAALVLIPDVPEFKDFRSRQLKAAGENANESAIIQLGAAGFAAAPANTAKLSSDIWQAYGALEFVPWDDSDVMHQMILALAHGPKQSQLLAHKYVKNVIGKLQPKNPFGGLNQTRLRRVNFLFWFDSARLCSLAGDAPNALYCLRIAVASGLPVGEDVRLHPDLNKLQKDRPDEFSNVLAGK